MEREKLIATVTAAQNGDSDALNKLFNAFYNDVYYFALKTVKDDDLACDITQETFVEIINTIGDLQEPAAFVKWMKQITYHQCTRYFKKKKDVLVEEDEDGNTVFDTLAEDKTEFIPDEALDQQDFRDTILAMLDELSEEQRSATMLYYYDELSVKQIAEIQNVSEGTVKSRLNYARKSIKSSVETYEKKNGIKLHCAGVLPLMLWLLSQTGKETMPAAAAKTVAGGVTAATGVTVSVSAGGAAAAAAATASGVGIAAKIAALPVVVKVIAGVVAGALVLGGVGMAVLSGKEAAPTDPVITTAPSDTEETTAGQTQQAGSAQATETALCVPENCTYITASGQEIPAGAEMPKAPRKNDRLLTVDYEYTFSGGGWGAHVRDTEKTEYEPFLPQVLGYPLTYLSYAFENCKALVIAPNIPESVTNLSSAFLGCSSLVRVPNIPEGVTDLSFTFKGCQSLVDVPNIPEGTTKLYETFYGCGSLVSIPNLPKSVTNMWGAFYECTSLQSIPDIPQGVTNLACAFYGCSALVDAPNIPEGITSMFKTFYGCSSLVNVPNIPEGVTSLEGTFQGCTSLVNAPSIPKGVTNMEKTFWGCTSLLNAPSIPEGVTNMKGTFQVCRSLVNASNIPEGVTNIASIFEGCHALVNAPSIPKSVTNMTLAFNNCKVLTGSIEIHANPEEYGSCFNLTRLSISLTGSSTMLAELAATSTFGNVTVQPS